MGKVKKKAKIKRFNESRFKKEISEEMAVCGKYIPRGRILDILEKTFDLPNPPEPLLQEADRYLRNMGYHPYKSGYRNTRDFR